MCTSYANGWHEIAIAMNRVLLDAEPWTPFDTATIVHNSFPELVQKHSHCRIRRKVSQKHHTSFSCLFAREVLTHENIVVFCNNCIVVLQKEIYDTDDSTSPTKTNLPPLSFLLESAVFCESALTGFLRFTGSYLALMNWVPPTAICTFSNIYKLLDLYYYTVCTCFIPVHFLARVLSSRVPSEIDCSTLLTMLKRIQKELGVGDRTISLGLDDSMSKITGLSFLGLSGSIAKIPSRYARLAPAVHLNKEDDLFGICNRIVACKTLTFVLVVIRMCKSYIKLAGVADHFIQSKMDTYQCAITQLQECMYASVSPTIGAAYRIPAMVSATSFELDCTAEEPNEYVYQILETCDTVWKKLSAISNGSIRSDVAKKLWSYMIRAIMESLVDGFSSVSSCTLQGRKQMDIDLFELQSGLCKLSSRW